MNRALAARLARLESARGYPLDTLTDAEREPIIRDLVKELGGLEALLARLDDSDPHERRLRELLHLHEFMFRRPHEGRE
jgi:hypothetical protein